MKHDTFAKWLKVVIVITTLIGIACIVLVIPGLCQILDSYFPEFGGWLLPWQITVDIASIPCFVAMFLCWLIASNIQKDNSFCMANSKLFKIFSYLALGDSIYFAVASIVLWLVNMNHPGLLLIQFFICFVGLAIFVCTSALSYFIEKAATLQEDNDLTI